MALLLMGDFVRIGKDIPKWGKTKSIIEKTTCFVAIEEDQNVIAYYTSTSESLGREIIPEKYLNKIPQNYNAPVILLGRLARDISKRGSGLGEYLLLDALFRSYKLSNESIGAMAVVVDPINKKAVEFYKKYGFEFCRATWTS